MIENKSLPQCPPKTATIAGLRYSVTYDRIFWSALEGFEFDPGLLNKVTDIQSDHIFS